MPDEPTDTVEAARGAEDAILNSLHHGALCRFDADNPCTCHVRGYIEAIRTGERSKAQPDSALRAAAREALHWLNEAFERRPMHGAIAAADRLQAALDGAPYEPSVDEVERAAEVMYQVNWDANEDFGASFEELARAALKAAYNA